MHQCRVYFPIGADALRTLATTGEVAVPTVHTVTEALERAHPSEDEEGLEYLALLAASAEALAARTRPSGRRVPAVVAAADVASDTLTLPARPLDPLSLVTATAPVRRRTVVSFHVEEPAAGVAAGAGDPDLLWYDVTELAEVVRLVS